MSQYRKVVESKMADKLENEIADGSKKSIEGLENKLVRGLKL